jgi:hypothetical protein
MSIIKNHLQIELSIDKILYRLRLLRLNELQQKQNLLTPNNNTNTSQRPSMEPRSTSQFNVRLPMMESIDENDEMIPSKRTEKVDPTVPQIVQSSRSTPMIVALSDQVDIVYQKKKDLRERSSTKRGLLMTKPE